MEYKSIDLVSFNLFVLDQLVVFDLNMAAVYVYSPHVDLTMTIAYVKGSISCES
jgi:hypothetical protein